MDCRHKKVVVYTNQRPVVLETIQEKSVCYVKREFIEMKYEETSKLFLECYDWFITKAQNIVNRPADAEYAIWAFTDQKYVGLYNNTFLLTLEVPIKEIIFFKMEDWNKILNFKYLSINEEDNTNFENKLKLYNINNETEIFMKPYYPQLKSEIKKSWNNLFRYDSFIKQNGIIELPFQTSLWEIRKSWIVDVKEC